MKRLSFVGTLLLSLVLVRPAAAQVEFGGSIGVNMANLDISPSSSEYSSFMGLGISAIVRKVLNETFSVQVQPQYIQKGANEDDDGDEYKIRLALFEIPVIVIAQFGSGEIRPYVLAGPSLGFVSSAEVSYDGPDESFEVDLKDRITSTEFSFIVGAGASKAVGNNSFFGEVRYAAGLSNLNGDEDESDGEITSSGIQLLIGILFGRSSN